MCGARGSATIADMTAISRTEFIKRAAALGVMAAAGPLTATSRAAGGRERLAYRGVCYDTGWGSGPDDFTRPLWSSRLMEGELRAIHEQLHCNAVQVFGTDIERMVEASTEARRRGLHVWLQPRLVERPQREILAHLARTAREAERLRRRHGGLALVTGCEHILFTPGIVPGKDFQERVDNLSDPSLDFRAVQRRLNRFLARAVATTRAHFKGKITYAPAFGAERVDWRPFDYVGVDYYEFHRKRADYVAELRALHRWRKPIVVCEFGTCAFRGAPRMEGGGWTIVDYTKPVPEIPGKVVRDERVQADHIVRMLDVFEASGVHAASVYAFIQPDCPSSPNPRHDIGHGGLRRGQGDPRALRGARLSVPGGSPSWRSMRWPSGTRRLDACLTRQRRLASLRFRITSRHFVI